MHGTLSLSNVNNAIRAYAITITIFHVIVYIVLDQRSEFSTLSFKLLHVNNFYKGMQYKIKQGMYLTVKFLGNSGKLKQCHNTAVCRFFIPVLRVQESNLSNLLQVALFNSFNRYKKTTSSQS
jgi:hypothetical protein